MVKIRSSAVVALSIALAICVGSIPAGNYMNISAQHGPKPTPTVTQRPAIVPSPAPYPLSGIKIGIDPGHQLRANMGSEPLAPGSSSRANKVTGGTMGIVTGIHEHTFDLELAFILKGILEDYGAEVFMTRTTADVNITNAERAQLVNDSGCIACIRIHADGFEDRNVHGVSVLIPSIKYSSQELCDKSRLLGESILNSVAQKTGARNRGLIERSNMAGFNWSKVPVCLIECGFMSNPDEDRLLSQQDYREKIANGIAEGFIKYYSDIK